MKVIFLGTPDFGATILNGILNSKHQVVGVVCQPDRINLRGKKVKLSPVKEIAQKYNLPLFQFEKISKENTEELSHLGADIMVTAAFGQILPIEILNLTLHGVFNIHGSILPKYRGASPVQSAIMDGLTETGVTVMKTELSMDSGDIVLIKKCQILPEENAQDVLNNLAKLGSVAICQVLDMIENGTANFTKQDHTKATFCKKILKEDLRINFNSEAESVVNLIRALSPTPAAFTEFRHGRLKILAAKVCDAEVGVPGEVVEVSKNGIVIKCKTKGISPLIVQGENANSMPIDAFLRGKRFEKGEIL